MKLGVCYYPEQWPSSRWATDAKLMVDAGITLVRIGEFAWSKMEPDMGNYQWDWLDEAIETLSNHQLSIILCTPTAAPPAWLIQQYSDILPVDQYGSRRRFGTRRHYCPNNPHFRLHTEKIAAEMAGRYGNDDRIVAWQIDNEFACYLPRCYCPLCVDTFQSWLEKKYQNLTNLNESWGTNFWSQTYTNWTQIEPPNLTVAEPNPSHKLDYYRFFSDTWVSYQQLQIDVLRQHISSKQKITHNIIASLTDIDYYQLAKSLDFISWDSYPTGYQENLAHLLEDTQTDTLMLASDLGHPDLTEFFHSLTRGFHKSPFWIMEQQTGQINWSSYNTGVNQGAIRLWTWQAFLSGAEAVVFFRWRASRSGLEQYHAGLRKHDGEADIGYNDLVNIKSDLELMDRISQDKSSRQVAILFDYNHLWALDLQPHRKGFSYLKLAFSYYYALRRLGYEVDIVAADSKLDVYKLVVAPTLVLGEKSLANRLSGYVKQGGTLLVGIRSGFKTETNLATDLPLPGVYSTLLGTKILAWQSLLPGLSYGLKTSLSINPLQASIWVECLKPLLNVESIIEYTSGSYSGYSALTRNKIGKGAAYHLGWYPSTAQLDGIIKMISEDSLLPAPESPPPGTSLFLRGNNHIYLNFTNQSIEIRKEDSIFTIAPRDVLVK